MHLIFTHVYFCDASLHVNNALAARKQRKFVHLQRTGCWLTHLLTRVHAMLFQAANMAVDVEYADVSETNGLGSIQGWVILCCKPSFMLGK